MTDTMTQATDDAALEAHRAAVAEWAGTSPPLDAVDMPLVDGSAYMIWGGLMLAASVIALIIVAMMDTSVEGYSAYGSSRIVNLGLQQRQSLLALFAATLFIGSLMLIAVGSIIKRLSSGPVPMPMIIGPTDLTSVQPASAAA